jgi:hypothetical protein
MRLPLLTLGVLLFIVAPASANLIDFTQLSLGPAQTITYQGVTISGRDGALVGTVLGQGLGVGDLGSLGTLDRTERFQDGAWQSPAGPRVDRDITLSVDGIINAVTLQPFMRVTGPALGDTVLPLEISLGVRHVDWVWGYGYTYISSIDPTTFTFAKEQPYTVQLGLGTDFGEAINFIDFLAARGYPDTTFDFGYSIVSMDYTPTEPVPEPASLALLLTAVGLFAARRHK